MTDAELEKQIVKNTADIAAVWESSKSAHKRIDNNDRITEGIHKLAANMEALTAQVKLLAEQLESSVERLESGQKSQGERIGALEKEPGQKWKDAMKQIFQLAVAAAFGGIVAALFGG